jgi:hypothetical protein
MAPESDCRDAARASEMAQSEAAARTPEKAALICHGWRLPGLAAAGVAIPEPVFCITITLFCFGRYRTAIGLSARRLPTSNAKAANPTINNLPRPNLSPSRR